MSPHGLVEGSTVMGIFRDEKDMQDFVVMGSLFGFPTLVINGKYRTTMQKAPQKREVQNGDSMTLEGESRGDYDSSIR